MLKLSLRTFLAILLAVFLTRILFPGLHTHISSQLSKFVGLDPSPAQLAETLGRELSIEGLHNAISFAFDYAQNGEMYPVSGIK